jgi:hypothetical protein
MSALGRSSCLAFARALAIVAIAGACGSSTEPGAPEGGADGVAPDAARMEAASSDARRSSDAAATDSATEDADTSSPDVTGPGDAPTDVHSGTACGTATCRAGDYCCYPSCSVCSTGAHCPAPPGGC